MSGPQGHAGSRDGRNHGQDGPSRGSGGGGQGGVGGDQIWRDGGRRDGDWDCSACGANNYSRRTECFKCRTPKDSNMSGPQGHAGSRDGRNRGRGGPSRGSGGGGRGGAGGQGGSNRGGRNPNGLNPSSGRGGSYNNSVNSSGNALKDASMIISLLGRGKSIQDVIRSNPGVYSQAFKYYKQLTISQVETLIITMAKLQASFHFEEPPISMYCKELVEIYVDHHSKSKSESDYAEKVTPKIEYVLHYAEVSRLF